MGPIWINNRAIGPGHPVFIIAEIGINHNGSLALARQLIRRAADAGVDAVKFQKRDLASLYRREVLNNPTLGEQALQTTLATLREVELTESDYGALVECCQEEGVLFLCTPFDKPSADFIAHLGAPAFKVASADMTNLDLLEHLCRLHKPLIVSTGMSVLDEITRTVGFLKAQRTPFALLHCNSTYPAAHRDINLRFMGVLRREFDVPVGYSGHERGIAISEAAVALGACVVERHFTLDRTMRGPDHAASLEYPGLAKLVRDIRNVEDAMGSGTKFLNRGEVMNREVLAKSLVATRDIEPGTIITREMIVAKSPAKGISPQRIDELVGRAATRLIATDEYFNEADCGNGVLLEDRVEYPGRWGLITRFKDVDLMASYEPSLLEFHLSDGDIAGGVKLNGNFYRQAFSVHIPEYWHHGDSTVLLDTASGHPEKRRLAVRVAQRCIDIAREMKGWFTGSQDPIILVLHPGGMTRDAPLTEKQGLYENLICSLDELDEEGVEVLLENMPPYPWFFGGQWYHNLLLDPDEIIEFCERTGRHLCLDTSHAGLYAKKAGLDPVDYMRRLAPHSRHIHLADSAGVSGEGLQIGEGELDFEGIMHLIQEKLSDCCVIPEIWQGHLHKGSGFLRAMREVSQYVQPALVT